MEKTDEEMADEWQSGLFDAISTLASSPRRFATAPENARFRQELRQLIYRRRIGSVAYRILFAIIETPDDAPLVRVLHVRHGAASDYAD